MRASLLSVSSFALVATAVAAVLAPSQAQDVPVVYRTDPGAAHPRYAEPVAEVKAAAPMQVVSPARVTGQAAPSVVQPTYSSPDVRAFEVAATYQSDPLYGTTERGTIAVQPGDTVYGIARRYGVRPADLISANRLSAPYRLSIGQPLIIPDSGPALSATPVAFAAAASPAPVPSASRVYVVQPGDTLYSLSRQFGVELTTLAAANGLRSPYNLAIEQTLRIPSGAGGQIGSPIDRLAPTPDIVTPAPDQPYRILVSKSPNARFAWPIRGAILREYGPGADGQRYDGIAIAAPVGAPIRAADAGEVVYTGRELDGYGNLLLISHEDGWVSAYAHTDTILVRKGDRVRQGQVVAKVGNSGGVAQPQLHFELRHDLQPRDPLMALTGQDMLARTDLQ